MRTPYTYYTRSMLTGKLNAREIDCELKQLVAWQSGQSLKEAMPQLSVEDREFMISGITPEEWYAAVGRPTRPHNMWAPAGECKCPECLDG